MKQVDSFYVGVLWAIQVIVHGYDQPSIAEEIIGGVDADVLWQTALQTGCDLDCQSLVKCRPYRDQPSKYRKGRQKET